MINIMRTNILFSTLPGIILALLTYMVVPGEEYPKAPVMAAIMVLMATWWIQDRIPIPATSLLPIFLFPFFELDTAQGVSLYYGRPIIFLFLGGFILALGLQNSNAHKRLALKIVDLIGSKAHQLILGFMIVSGFLSMWISNTASVMVMLPIGLSVIENVKGHIKDDNMLQRFGLCFVLGIAYSANIGGMATLIGTPPNLIFLQIYSEIFPDRPPIGFLEWMMIGLPLSVIFILSGWYILSHWIFPIPKTDFFDGESNIKEQIKDLGPIRKDEVRALLIFGLAALLWMSGSDIKISDDFTIHGWRSLLNLELVTDPAIAVFTALLLFIILSGNNDGKALLSWKETRELPWGILLLFGGGFAIAGGFESSGLTSLVSALFTQLPVLPPILLLSIVCVFVAFQTEITSNSAVTTLVLPILAAGSAVFGTDPKFLMISATLSASCAFMMPIATPPQAIVYASGYVTIRQMMKAGIWFNLLGISLTIILFSIIHYFFW